MDDYVMMRSAKYTTLIVIISTISIFGLIGGSSEIGGVTNDNEIKNIAIEVRQKILQNHFDIDISPHVVSVDMGAIRIPAVPSSVGSGSTWAITQPGNPIYDDWTIISNSHADDRTLEDWWKDTIDGKEVRKDITLNYRVNPQEIPIRTINCMNAFPVSYNPGDYLGSGQVLVEKIVVRCNYVTMQ